VIKDMDRNNRRSKRRIIRSRMRNVVVGVVDIKYYDM
jgi:hypothetical protein